MQYSIKDKSFDTLFALYNQEVDILKSKLLDGESWEDLKSVRRNITELAIVLHKEHNYIVPQHLNNPAEFPRLEEQSTQQPK